MHYWLESSLGLESKKLRFLIAAGFRENDVFFSSLFSKKQSHFPWYRVRGRVSALH